MYSVSQAFLDAVKQPAQEHRIQGVISGSIGNTSFDESNIKSGTFHVTNQSTDTNDVVLGSVYVGTLTATFYGLDSHIDRYSWIGRRITPSFGLRIGTNEWEDVPLGIFTVKEAVHTAEGIEITAYDDMIKFDKKFKPENFQFQGGMWAFIDQVCEDCGVDNGMTDEYIESLPNGDKDLMIAGAYGPLKDFANDIETYRDLVFWMAQTMACFATINRDGALEFRQYKGVDNYVDTITETHRLAGATFDDYVTNYTGVWYKNIKEGTDSYYGYDPEELEAALQRSQDHLVDLEGQLTQLEADYAAGRISESEYKAQKKELNRRIKNVKKRIKWEMDALEHIEDGSFMEMGANPFLQTGTGESVIDMRNNVLNALDAISYTPFSCSTVVGVHYDLGDIIQFTGGHATEAGEACCLMMYDYNLNGAYVMEGFGVDPAIPMVHNTNEKSANAANKNGLSAGRISVGSTVPETGNDGDLHINSGSLTIIGFGEKAYGNLTELERNVRGSYIDITAEWYSASDDKISYPISNLKVGKEYTFSFEMQTLGVVQPFSGSGGPWLYGVTITETSNQQRRIQPATRGVWDPVNLVVGAYFDNDNHTYSGCNFTATAETMYLQIDLNGTNDVGTRTVYLKNFTFGEGYSFNDTGVSGVSVYYDDEWHDIDFVRSVEQTQTSGTKIATVHNSDGTETDIYAPNMTGASASAAGAKGLVPAPAQGDENKFLRGDGTWAQGGGGTTVVANPTGVATASLKKLQVDETIYQIVGGGGSGSGFEQTVLWDYEADNGGSVLFGLVTATLHDAVENYDAILIDVVSVSSDMTDANWKSTFQFHIDVNALSESFNPNYILCESAANRTSRYYIQGTTLQKTSQSATNTNGLVRVYGLKFGGGSGSGSEYSFTNLWTGSQSTAGEITLNDNIENYDLIQFICQISNGGCSVDTFDTSYFLTEFPYKANPTANDKHYCPSTWDNAYARVITGSSTDKLYTWDFYNSQRIMAVNGIKLGSGTGTIDTAMSDTSKNAVQNKVIKKYVDDVIAEFVDLTTSDIDDIITDVFGS